MAYRKEIHSLLITTSEGTFINSSAAGFGRVVQNENAHTGRLYLDYSGFSTPTAGVVVSLYASHNGFSWYLQTAYPAGATAYSKVLNLDYIPRYSKIGYTMGASRINSMRAILEADAEY